MSMLNISGYHSTYFVILGGIKKNVLKFVFHKNTFEGLKIEQLGNVLQVLFDFAKFKKGSCAVINTVDLRANLFIHVVISEAITDQNAAVIYMKM